MWLDDLSDLVGTLKERIERHRDELGKNETATRYALIDPLLTAMGWNLQDPGEVKTEYDLDGTGLRTDYTMFTGEDKKKPQLVVEAKKLSAPIGDEVVKQAFNYCSSEGIPYFAVTNGKAWKVYQTFGEAYVRLADKRIVDFNLMDSAQTAVMNMLWLWRGNFKSEHAPIVPVVQDRSGVATGGAAVEQPAVPEVTPCVDSRGIPLQEFSPSKGDRPPAALHFPDGTVKRINHWNQIQSSVVEWLVDTRRLTEDNCPIQGKGGGYLVATTPFKSKGTPFHIKKQIGSVWIELDRTGVAHVSAAQTILNAMDVDHAAVRVII